MANNHITDKVMAALPPYEFKVKDLIKNGRTTKSNVEDVKRCLKYNSKIPEISDEQIAMFLIACDNNIETAQSIIENYFKFRSAAPELFDNRDVDSEEAQFTLSVSNITSFPKRTKDNYAIGMAALKDTYYYNYYLDQQIKIVFASMDLTLRSEPPSGIIFIIDLKGVGIMHLTRLKVGVMKKALFFLQEGLPTKLKQIHILNASYIFGKILVMFRPFMKKELYDMIIPHPPSMSMEDFFEKHVPACCMPSDFGGELPTLEKLTENFQNECRKHKAFLEALEKQVQLCRNET